ncbi:MAG: hypothetical protein ABEI53_03040 [Candidatus Magasanikbacteria bacterium]
MNSLPAMSTRSGSFLASPSFQDSVKEARRKSQKVFYNNQDPVPVRENELLFEKLIEDLGKDYADQAFFLPREQTFRGLFRSTEVIIFRKEDIQEVELGFLRGEFSPRKHLQGFSHELKIGEFGNLPLVTTPEKAESTESFRVLVNGFWAWYGQKRHGKDEGEITAEGFWPCGIRVSSRKGFPPYLSGYIRRPISPFKKMWDLLRAFNIPERLDHFYFPVSKNNFEEVKSYILSLK